MADSRATDQIALHERMISVRSTFDRVYQDIDDRISPTDQNFGSNTANENKGKQKTEKVFDATPSLALDRFKAAMHSLVTPRNQQWGKNKAMDEDLADDMEVQRYLDEVTKRQFAARYAGNFDAEIQGCYYSAGKYGTMGMFVGEQPGKGLFYRAIPMKQLYIAENEFGTVDLVHRDWFWTARQAMSRWGDKCPPVIKQAVERRPDQEFRFLHCVKPRKDADVSRADYRGMQYLSYFICVDSRDILEEGGFRTFPYAISRYDVVPGEVYGRSPCMTILPDVKMLNTMNHDTVKAAQLKMLPPLLANRANALDAMRMTPAGMNYGGIDDQGRAMIQKLDVGGDIGIGIEMMDQKRMVINDALLNTLFQILIDKPNITATEAMLRAQEKGQLVGPTGSRIESEFLDTMWHRELDLLAAANQLPEMPEKLRERGGLYKIEFDSPLSRARRAEEGVAIMRSIEQLSPIAAAMGPEAAPMVFKRINLDAMTKVIFEVNGVPAKVLYTDDEMEAMDEQSAQAAQAQTLLGAAPVIADTAKNLAQAQSIAATAEGQPMPAVA